MKYWIRASYLNGMRKLLEAYGGPDLASNVFGGSTLTEDDLADVYQRLDYPAIAPIFDSILLNVDSLQDFCRLNSRLRLVNPWGLGEVFAAQARSRTLLEYWARLQSVSRLMVSRWSSSMEDDGEIISVVSDWSHHPGIGLPTLGAFFSVHQIKDLFGVAPISMRMPYHAGAMIRERLTAELPNVEMTFEPSTQIIRYRRQEALSAPPIPINEAPRLIHRDLLRAYYPPNRREAAILVLDCVESLLADDEEPTLELVAEKASIPPRELQRALSSGGLSMRSAIERIRVTKAEELLAETDQPILDVALESGYTSHQALSRVFKRWRGLTPTEYRVFVKKHQSIEDNSAAAGG